MTDLKNMSPEDKKQLAREIVKTKHWSDDNKETALYIINNSTENQEYMDAVNYLLKDKEPDWTAFHQMATYE